MKITQIMFYWPKLHFKKSWFLKLNLKEKKLYQPKINKLSSEKKGVTKFKYTIVKKTKIYNRVDINRVDIT